jgi:outer membrane protein TolC
MKTVFLCLALLPGVWGQSSSPLKLSLSDAIERGLKTNLGVLQRETGDRLARVERMRALSVLLPTVKGAVSENVQEMNLAVFGFRFPGVPSIIGPYGYSDIRANASLDLFDWSARKHLKVADQNLKAAQLSTQDARDLVVQAVANAYLSIIAGGARVDASQAEVATAQALYERARDQHTSGVSPAIDELRAQVELKSRQQQLLIAENQLAKNHLALARVIGLNPGQAFELADSAPYAPLEGLSPEQMFDRARQSRADYQSLKAQLQAAEITREAALAQRYPTVSLNGDFGLNGVNQAQLHNTFAFTGAVKINIFDGGRIHADVAQSDAIIQQRKDEIADLERQIDVDIRAALLDLKSASDQVAVAQSNLDLANQTLAQARDRFAAGVTDNIEVVQAQDSVANAQEALIGSMYGHNLAKVTLARAVGMTETNLKQFMGAGK